MNLKEFSHINHERCVAPNGFNHTLTDWSPSDWLAAVTGELGEAANVVKKLNRIRDGIPGNTETFETYQNQLADEIADVFIYLDLFATRLGLDLTTIVQRKFNVTSAKIGYPQQWL